MRMIILNHDLGEQVSIIRTISQCTKKGEVEIPDAHIMLRRVQRADYGDIYEVSVEEGPYPITDRSLEGLAESLNEGLAEGNKLREDEVFLQPVGEYFADFDRRTQLDEINRAKMSFPNARDYVALLYDLACQRIPSVSAEMEGRAYEAVVECVTKYIASDIRRKYPTFSREWDDMIQSALLDFCKQMPNYDPSKGRPTTFIAPIITHAVYEYLAHLRQTTPHYLQIENDIAKLKRRIAAFEGDEAVTPERVYELLQGKYSAEQIISNWDLVDRAANVSIDNEESIGELPDTAPNPEEVYLEKERRELIIKLFRAALTPRELQILMYAKAEGRKANQATAKFGITATELKNIVVKAMKRLRAEAATNKYGDDIRHLVEQLWRRHRREMGYSSAKLENDSELMLAQSQETQKFFDSICPDFDDSDDTADYSFADPESMGIEIPTFSDEDSEGGAAPTMA